ncbi:type II secretion system minor pseudopilin GspH [Kangiella koreensis]|uniref:Type II secretion system protein H n=1 Tax=Kangiella koreensis (strain DSM 16069 / JCM 12317 / KCTC 12182 / SW-125) TaxID=523791 RepID=C7R8F6_KANKD|nr:type II secretion system minor pseudopilin GspH [Kangiella koreensis]ACV27721.1 general secretion pathway protein H [Kangiella koreensis DSM 16069]
MKPISTATISKQSFRHPITQAGFTLLEILIALAIAGIMLSVAVIAFSDNDAAKLKNKAHQLFGLIQIAQEESIIRGIEVGIRVEQDGYSFMIYDGTRWNPLQDHPLLRKVELDEPIEMYVNVEGQEALLGSSNDDVVKGDAENEQAEDEQTNKVEPPQIFILSSGEMNEFTVTIGLDRDDARFYRVTGNYLGDVELTPAIEGHYRHDWDLELNESF